MIENKANFEECLLTRNVNFANGPRKENSLRGPCRVIRLCILGILLPCFILAMVLYVRYKVYVEQLYPLAMSDMRLLDNRISTTWCQKQHVKTNATFNAFLLPSSPTFADTQKTMSMVRHLELEDDTKEYWGFYLLKGSTVTISTCVRWPGASLIVIRGHKHLHECAYIGDNSSEELEELLEAIGEGSYVSNNNDSFAELGQEDDAPSNNPTLMHRHREDVQFHHPRHNDKNNANHTLEDEELDTTDITDAITLKKILAILNEKASKKVVPKPKVHMHRNSTIGRGEIGNINIQNVAVTKSQRTVSEELLHEVLGKLSELGDRGGTVLEKINHNYKNRQNVHNITAHNEQILNLRGRNKVKQEVVFDDNIDKARRRKRDLIIHTAMSQNLNENDEENNAAVEEGFTPDGIADHHAIINETTLNDKSNSEFWSSFSSSEEALLNCAGLILNLPLTPHMQCKKELSDFDVESAYLANRVTYKVPTNGYYFFVFNSENEIQTNYVRVNFHIDKTVYNVSNSIAQCENRTEECAVNLNFFSNEKLVMELPIKEEDLWNEEYVVVSICEPRTSIYVACVIAVPIFVILFAFQ